MEKSNTSWKINRNKCVFLFHHGSPLPANPHTQIENEGQVVNSCLCDRQGQGSSFLCGKQASWPLALLKLEELSGYVIISLLDELSLRFQGQAGWHPEHGHWTIRNEISFQPSVWGHFSPTWPRALGKLLTTQPAGEPPNLGLHQKAWGWDPCSQLLCFWRVTPLEDKVNRSLQHSLLSVTFAKSSRYLKLLNYKKENLKITQFFTSRKVSL